MTIGTKIRNLRIFKGYSQENMAQMLELSVTSYSKIERDEVKPTIDRLEQIGKILQMPVQDILSFGESNVFLNKDINCENGGFVGNGIVVSGKADTDFILQYEKLKQENEALKQRVKDLEKSISYLEHIVSVSKN